MPVPPCAHRCEVVQLLVLREARRGQSEAAVRIALGLSREYVAPVPPRLTPAPLARLPLPVAPTGAAGTPVTSPRATSTDVHTPPLAAAECCDATQ